MKKMELEWRDSWDAWDADGNIEDDYTFHRRQSGYDIFSDDDGLYLYLVDMDGNVGRFDAGDTPYEDFEEWLSLAFSQIDLR